jgi:precorrin-3B synthase
MNGFHRRAACPGVSAPMATGDGLLVRIRPQERIALGALSGLCEAARRHGNGIIEISARGSIQVRGLAPKSAPLFASAVASLKIAETCSVAVIADPLRDDAAALVDSAALAFNLRRAIARAQLELAAKVSIAVDGGGRLHLDALNADIRLRAVEMARGPRLDVALGGDARSASPLGVIRLSAAGNVVMRLLSVIAARGPTVRAADILRSNGLNPFRSAIVEHVEPAPVPPPRPPAPAIGKHPLRDGRVALGVAPAFGQTDAEALAQLAVAAADYGAHAAGAAPGRALLLIDLMEDKADALAAIAEQLGFIVRLDDPRRRIVACPGRPACASGFIAARALAAEIAQHLSPVPDGTAIHISGCAKGCAHPIPAALTVVGGEHGCGIIHQGSARSTPRRYVDPADLVAEIVGAAARRSGAGHG